MLCHDMFLFAGGMRSSVQVIMDELNRFERFSGLQVNKQKSAILWMGQGFVGVGPRVASLT